MKILVTGSKGLIGSALCAALQRIDIEVSRVDLKEDRNTNDFGDILDIDYLNEKLAGCDGVVHLAAVSRVIEGERNPRLCWDTNVKGTLNIIEAALHRENKPWIIYSSSREVYGQQQRLPVCETDPICPMNIYGESKAEAERMILAARNQGLSTAILRFSNVFGSVNDYPDRVIPAFCLAAMTSSQMRVEGMEQIFDFTFIDDVVYGILSTILLLEKNRYIQLSPIHLTTGNPCTLGELANIINQACHNGASIVEAPSRTFDVSRFYGDPERARTILNWRACINIENGIQRLIKQYQLKLMFESRTFASEKTN